MFPTSDNTHAAVQDRKSKVLMEFNYTFYNLICFHVRKQIPIYTFEDNRGHMNDECRLKQSLQESIITIVKV